MIKRNYIAVIATLLITCIQFTTFAAMNNLTSLLDKTQLSAATEQNEVQEALAKLNVKNELIRNKLQYGIRMLDGVYNPDDLEYGAPYKVVYVDRALNNAFLTQKNLAPFIAQTSYFWEVPVLLRTASNKVVTSFIIDKIKGKWAVCEIGADLSNESVAFSSDPDRIKTALQKNGMENATNLYHLRFVKERQDYLYASNAEQECFIPLAHTKPHSDSIEGRMKSALTTSASEPEKNKQTKDEVIKKVGIRLIPNDTKKGPNQLLLLGGSGNTDNTPVTHSPFILYLTLGSGAVVALSFWLILRKKATH